MVRHSGHLSARNNEIELSTAVDCMCNMSVLTSLDIMCFDIGSAGRDVGLHVVITISALHVECSSKSCKHCGQGATD